VLLTLDTAAAEPTWKISWTASDYAICYIVLKGEQVVAFTLDTEYAVADTGAAYTIRAVGQSGTLSPLSDVAAQPKPDDPTDPTTGVAQQPSLGVLCYAQGGQLHLTRLPDGARVEVYNVMGQKIHSRPASGSSLSLPANGFCIVRVSAPKGEQVFKVVVS
jgi:putative hemolysin